MYVISNTRLQVQNVYMYIIFIRIVQHYIYKQGFTLHASQKIANQPNI